MKSDTTLDYKDFINVIKRGKWIIILITMLLTLTAASINYYSMKSSNATYKTTTSVVLGKEEDILVAKVIGGTFEQIASSNTIARQTSAELKGSISTIDVQKSYTIAVSADAPILTITASGESQKKSREIADAVYSSFAKEANRIYPKLSLHIMDTSVDNGTSNNAFKFSTVILAFLLGLFLSIFIVTFIGFFDEKIRTKHDIEKYLELDVIGKLPKRKRRDI